MTSANNRMFENRILFTAVVYSPREGWSKISVGRSIRPDIHVCLCRSQVCTAALFMPLAVTTEPNLAIPPRPRISFLLE